MPSVSVLCLATVWLVGTRAALPLAEPESAPLVNNHLTIAPLDQAAKEEAVEKYFANLDLELMLGEPDEDAGDRVATWTPDSKRNPETLGNYFQGDILFPSEEGRNALPNLASRWPGAVIPYVISGSFSTYDLDTIKSAMAAFHVDTCVRFVPRTTHNDYITISNTNTGCWATLGRWGGSQIVNLQTPGCTYWLGTVIHELNHAAGFMHEHCRIERDTYVNILWDNIEAGQSYNFVKWTSPPLDGLGVSYDYTSVMHYEPYAFSANGLPTLSAKLSLNGSEIGQRSKFSVGDVIKINRMYNCTTYNMG